MTDIDEVAEFARVREAMKQPNAVFCFGSNLLGRHGAGAAATARTLYGAVLGKGEGLHGRSYALPTKDAQIRTRSLADIEASVDTFRQCVRDHPELLFVMTRVATGLAGYSDAQIAPLFHDMPENVMLPLAWGGR